MRGAKVMCATETDLLSAASHLSLISSSLTTVGVQKENMLTQTTSSIMFLKSTALSDQLEFNHYVSINC